MNRSSPPSSVLPRGDSPDLWYIPTAAEASGELPEDLPTSPLLTIFGTPHTCRAICSRLSRQDLCSLMRVCRWLSADIARELYRSLSYAFVVDTLMDRRSPRQKVYCNSVREIVARHAERTESLTYNPLNFNRLIPPLRLLCPALSSVRFSFDNPASRWSVSFDSVYSITGENTGRIVVYDQHVFDMLYDPPKSLNLPPAPSDAYQVHYHLDFTFSTVKAEPVLLALDMEERQKRSSALIGSWWPAMDDSPIFDHTYHTLDFSQFPICLMVVGWLYDRQLKLGLDYEDRIDTVIAYYMFPFTILELRDFAELASASLTVLRLVKQHADDEEHEEEGEYEGWDAKISFYDLSELIDVIRNTLPHLVVLHVLMKDIHAAEEICAGLLSSDSLEEGGTINDLMIATIDHPTPLFNVIRVISAICTADAYVSVNEFGDHWWTAEDQQEFLGYLRGESAERRPHLAVVDFRAIGMFLPAHARQLQYDALGRPFAMAFEDPESD